MNCFTLELYWATNEVAFYTVRIENDDEKNELTEMGDFIRTFKNDNSVKDELDVIMQTMKLLGSKGADEMYFRAEKRAAALPPPRTMIRRMGFSWTDEFQHLRLYCMRISSSVVVLFSGGIKTTRFPQDCPSVGSHFRIANEIALRIDEAILRRDIVALDRRLDYDDSDPFFL